MYPTMDEDVALMGAPPTVYIYIIVARSIKERTRQPPPQKMETIAKK
jgi:hypothetical protein